MTDWAQDYMDSVAWGDEIEQGFLTGSWIEYCRVEVDGVGDRCTSANRRNRTEGGRSMSLHPVTFCQAAIGLAGLSITLQAVAALARTRSVISTDEPAEPPAVVVTPTEPVLHERPSLKLTRMELLQHARALGIHDAKWRNSARKTELCRAIQQHNEQRRAA